MRGAVMKGAPLRVRRARRGSRLGSNIIEFAFCLVPYLTIISGAMDWAWYYHHRSALDYAAYVGCRAGAMVDPGQWSTLTTRAESAAVAAWEADWIVCPDCTFEITSVRAKPMRDLHCTITGTFSPMVGLVPAPDLVGHATVRMEIQQ